MKEGWRSANGAGKRAKIEQELERIGVPTHIGRSLLNRGIKKISSVENEPCLKVDLQLYNGDCICIKRARYFDVNPITNQRKTNFSFKVSGTVSLMAGIPPLRFVTPGT